MAPERRDLPPAEPAPEASIIAEARRLPERLSRLQGASLYRAIGLLFLAALVFRFFDPISRVTLIAFVGVIVAMALNAIVVRLPVSRGIATIIVSLAVLLGLAGAVWAAIRWLLPQLRAFIGDLPNVQAQVEEWEAQLMTMLGIEMELIGGVTEMLLENPFGTAMSLLSQAFGILEIVGLAVLVFFGAIFAVAKPNEQLLNPMMRAIPRDRRPAYRRMLKRMAERLVGWLRGTLISMAIIGAVSAIAFWVIGVPYAILLGFWVGLIEVIPIIGPWIGGVTVILVTLVFDPGLILWVVIAIMAIQQIEGNVVRPFVMSGAAELHPFVTLIGLLLFGTMFGLLGALLALPLLLAIGTAIEVLWIEETIGTDSDEIPPLVEESGR
jgi:putative permease